MGETVKVLVGPDVLLAFKKLHSLPFTFPFSSPLPHLLSFPCSPSGDSVITRVDGRRKGAEESGVDGGGTERRVGGREGVVMSRLRDI